MKITDADLAALAFRARDAVRSSIARLNGAQLHEDSTVTITLTCSLQRNAQDHFGVRRDAGSRAL